MYLAAPCRRALALAVLALLAVPLARAQITGVSYTFSPSVERVYWGDDAGLSDGYLYGGSFGLGFGEYLTVSGTYMTSTGLETDFGDFGGEADLTNAVLQEHVIARDVDVQRYGGKLRVGIGSGSYEPFLTVGTGVLRLEPDLVEESEHIYTTFGGGFTLRSAERFRLSVGAEILAYRYNPASSLLTPTELGIVEGETGLGPEDFITQTVYNPVLRASAAVQLGGRERGELTEVDRALREQFGSGEGLVLYAEPFYGRISFNEALSRFPDEQPLAGINLGVELGPYVGLRGFYWRATEDESVTDANLPEGFDDMQLFGGELHLRFGREFGRGFVPFLLLGGGYMDVMEDYQGGEIGVAAPEDTYFALGGGGVEVPLSESFTLQGGVRALLQSTEDADDLSQPNNVYASPLYTVGIEFSFGDDEPTPGEVLDRRAAEERAERLAQDEATTAELERLQTRLDSLDRAAELEREIVRIERQLATVDADDPAEVERLRAELRAAIGDRVDAERRARTRRAPAEAEVTGEASNLSGQTVTLPVPENGEIYIRFGQGVAQPVGGTTVVGGDTVRTAGGALTAQQVQEVVRATLQRELGDADGTLSAEQVRQIVRATLREEVVSGEGLTATQAELLLDRLGRLEDRIDRRLAAGQPVGETDVTVVTDDETPVAVTPAAAAEGRFGTVVMGRRLVGLTPYTGFRVGDGPTKVLLGVRGDYREATSSIRLLPEVAVGFGGGLSFSAFANGAVPFEARLFGPVSPYVGAGVGLVSESGLGGLELALNVLVGGDYTFSNGATMMVEYSTFDFFSYNRLLVGYRTTF